MCAHCRAVGGGASTVAEQPLLAGACEEKILGDMDFISLGELDWFSFDEPAASEGVHGVTGEMSGVTGLHLHAEIAGAEAKIGGSEIND